MEMKRRGVETKIVLEGDPKTLPAAHGKTNLEELFIDVAAH